MLRAILFLFLSSQVFTLNAQSKEDIISVLKAIHTLPQLDPLFQVDLSEGPTMVLVKSDRLNSGSNDLERNYFTLTNDDLWGFDRPVKIMTSQEADFQGVRRDKMVTLSLTISGDQCNVGLDAALEEGSRYFKGWVSLVRNGFDWEVTGQNVRTR